jgi:hypothetical protein
MPLLQTHLYVLLLLLSLYQDETASCLWLIALKVLLLCPYSFTPSPPPPPPSPLSLSLFHFKFDSLLSHSLYSLSQTHFDYRSLSHTHTHSLSLSRPVSYTILLSLSYFRVYIHTLSVSFNTQTHAWRKKQTVEFSLSSLIPFDSLSWCLSFSLVEN